MNESTGMIDKSVSYHFAKRNGILIVYSEQNQARAIYRTGCLPTAVVELRRYIDHPFQLEEVSSDIFAGLLTTQYELTTTDALEHTQVLGDTLDLKQALDELPKAEDILESENDSPVINLINALLHEAVKRFASDIHFEPFEANLNIRIRIDGILQTILEVPNLLTPLLISRLKILANLDISERRLPQDGRIAITIAGRIINIRASTIPVTYGERVVLRILDKEFIHLSLLELGMSDELLQAMKRIIARPHGIVLVTGPTGSGKTTTLYALLTELNSPGRNIMTVEDPIEYDVKGIAQIQVNTKVDMTFAKSLRAIMRQDPNIIMVGEIRDLDTAVIAVQASLTGHLVLSTLHTNTAVGAITRLRDLGVQSFLLSSSLIGVIAQRLIRLLCSDCKEPFSPPSDICDSLGISDNNPTPIYEARGCENCHHSGYRGRVGIYEIIEMDSTLQKLIHENKSEQDLTSYIRLKSPNIWQNACQRVLSGETSFSEILRITTE